MKFLFLLMAIPVMLVSQAGILPEVFSEANVVQFYNNGQEFSISESDEARFDELFVEAISGARQMPAFAVAIHKLTMQDFQEGYWVKFDYGKTMTACKMNFDQLLIHIQPNSYGVNIIRGNNGKFDGRCYYLDLDKNLDEVYNFLASVEHVEKPEIEVEIEKGEESEVKEVEEEEAPQPEKETSGNGDDDAEESSATNGKLIEEENEEEVVASEVQIPSVNEDRKEENKVIKQEATENAGALTEINQENAETSEETIEEAEEEKATASSVLMEAVSQWDVL